MLAISGIEPLGNFEPTTPFALSTYLLFSLICMPAVFWAQIALQQ
jgi:hypothetical protein